MNEIKCVVGCQSISCKDLNDSREVCSQDGSDLIDWSDIKSSIEIDSDENFHPQYAIADIFRYGPTCREALDKLITAREALVEYGQVLIELWTRREDAKYCRLKWLLPLLNEISVEERRFTQGDDFYEPVLTDMWASFHDRHEWYYSEVKKVDIGLPLG